MIEQCDLSERRACRLAGLSRDSYRHPPEADQVSKDLSGQIVEIAHARWRFGYRRIHDLLRPDFPGVNHKRVYKLHLVNSCISIVNLTNSHATPRQFLPAIHQD